MLFKNRLEKLMFNNKYNINDNVKRVITFPDKDFHQRIQD